MDWIACNSLYKSSPVLVVEEAGVPGENHLYWLRKIWADITSEG
jgi:hypothetical protein